MRTSDSNSGTGVLFARDDFRVCVSETTVSCEISAYDGGAEYRRTPWWLWWNVLSLDAPIVAVVWAALFARASGRKLSVAEAIALILSVWIIYLSDRLLDGYRARNRATLQDRHLFCERHRSAMVFLILAAGAAALWIIADHLPGDEITAGVKLGIILILYMAGIHSGYGWMAWIVPKEISVGLLFALGTTLPLWTQGLRFARNGYLPWSFFGSLCCLNCLSIECWENHHALKGWIQPPRPLVRWADSRIHFISTLLAAGALALCFFYNVRGASQFAWWAISGAALLILVLNSLRTNFSSAALRVLADVALLVPALIALAVQG